MGYLFDPEKLREIGARAVGKPFKEMVRSVIDDCAAEYPGHIDTREEWVFNLAAGATGVMTVLHASLTEYLIIFGSASGTEGYSGRYPIEIWDTVMAGEMWTYTEDDPGVKIVTRLGEMALLRKEQVKGFCIKDNTWLLEYGRGPIPRALPLALADATFSAIEPHIIWKTLKIYGRNVLRELRQGKI